MVSKSQKKKKHNLNKSLIFKNMSETGMQINK